MLLTKVCVDLLKARGCSSTSIVFIWERQKKELRDALHFCGKCACSISFEGLFQKRLWVPVKKLLSDNGLLPHSLFLFHYFTTTHTQKKKPCLHTNTLHALERKITMLARLGSSTAIRLHRFHLFVQREGNTSQVFSRCFLHSTRNDDEAPSSSSNPIDYFEVMGIEVSYVNCTYVSRRILQRIFELCADNSISHQCHLGSDRSMYLQMNSKQSTKNK